PPQVVVSAHGIPESYVRSGDPYVDEVKATLAGLAGRLPEVVFHLAFQSRATPVKWVGPATLDEIDRLGRAGVRNLVVLPISFVSDHVETLYEIDVQLAEAARAAGVEAFRRVPVFNDSPDLTAILRALVLEAAA
ncbi:MAG: ferrochelatase, partial [Planctomycetota bacterium]